MRGITVWVLGFFSFLAGLSSVNAVIMAVNLGLESTFQPYIIGGEFPVYAYLLISILATLFLLGGTINRLVSELSSSSLLNEIAARVSGLEDGQNAQNSLLESLKARVFLIDEGVENVRKESVKGFSTQGEMLKQFHTSVVGKFDSKIVDARDGMTKRIKEGFDEQGEMLRQFHTSIVNRLDTKLTDVKDGMTRQLEETAKTIEKGEQRDREIMTALIEEKTELTETKVKVTKLENALAQPKPLLTSQSSPEEVKGIGPSTGNELRQMGITSVGELVLTDPKLIAEKTSTSEKGAEKLQGRALLAMVPGLEEKDVNLLDEIGVTSRKELANQDPVELGWKINEVFKVRIEEGRSLEADKPTIEKIYSWVKSARA